MSLEKNNLTEFFAELEKDHNTLMRLWNPTGRSPLPYVLLERAELLRRKLAQQEEIIFGNDDKAYAEYRCAYHYMIGTLVLRGLLGETGKASYASIKQSKLLFKRALAETCQSVASDESNIQLAYFHIFHAHQVVCQPEHRYHHKKKIFNLLRAAIGRLKNVSYDKDFIRESSKSVKTLNSWINKTRESKENYNKFIAKFQQTLAFGIPLNDICKDLAFVKNTDLSHRFYQPPPVCSEADSDEDSNETCSTEELEYIDGTEFHARLHAKVATTPIFTGVNEASLNAAVEEIANYFHLHSGLVVSEIADLIEANLTAVLEQATINESNNWLVLPTMFDADPNNIWQATKRIDIAKINFENLTKPLFDENDFPTLGYNP